MKEITTLILDMYGVILQERVGDFASFAFDHTDSSLHRRLEKQFHEERLYTRAGYGELSSEEFLLRLGFKNPVCAMKSYVESCLTLDDAFIEFAEAHHTRYDFVLLSTDISEWSAYIMERFGLGRYFKHRIVSGDVKCRKPDKQIYEIALNRAGKTAQECIFIDDCIANVQAAEALGIRSVLFNRFQEEYDGKKVNSFSELSDFLKGVD